MHKSLFTTAAAALFGVLAVARPEGSRLKSRDIIKAIPEGASPRELKFKPWTDYDTDSCYNTAAVSEDGTANPGTGPTTTFQGNCRDPHQLENSNIYSRMRCNHGICAFM
ncbi:NPP1 family protein [Candidatus Bathyarchaeota archaeon]|nr:NPP1 family protein [Candidatus Bathyarchaeota archaeon]